jgi:hypothetical protein
VHVRCGNAGMYLFQSLWGACERALCGRKRRRPPSAVPVEQRLCATSSATEQYVGAAKSVLPERIFAAGRGAAWRSVRRRSG